MYTFALWMIKTLTFIKIWLMLLFQNKEERFSKKFQLIRFLKLIRVLSHKFLGKIKQRELHSSEFGYIFC